nr:MAG TPA: hypothetical protein [Caudoviricetes sp.]
MLFVRPAFSPVIRLLLVPMSKHILPPLTLCSSQRALIFSYKVANIAPPFLGTTEKVQNLAFTSCKVRNYALY